MKKFVPLAAIACLAILLANTAEASAKKNAAAKNEAVPIASAITDVNSSGGAAEAVIADVRDAQTFTSAEAIHANIYQAAIATPAPQANTASANAPAQYHSGAAYANSGVVGLFVTTS